MTRYQLLAQELATLIEGGVLRPGERIASSRTLARTRKLSAETVAKALYLLEDRGLIEARPRSGYFVRARVPATPGAPQTSQPPKRAASLDVSELVFEVLEATRDRRVVPLGSAFPSPALFPLPKLAQALSKAVRRLDPARTVEALSPGSVELRRQVARRYAIHGLQVLPEDIIITAGALEALNLCLQAVTRAGDVVALESPAFYAALQAVERLGLKAVEIPTHPAEGIDLGALDAAIRKHQVRACWLMTTLQNPLGATMPRQKKRELVALLRKHDVPLVEDDVYAELHFGRDALPPAKAFDDSGLVMHCGSFSKCLAPGYRLGWCVPGRAREVVGRLKLTTSIATSLPIQDGIAEYLKHGGYDHHLRSLRQGLAAQQAQMLRAIATHFPAARVTRPEGGYFVWLELPEGCDALALHRAALSRGISIAPGPIFSARRAFRNCIRLNYGHPWSEEMERSIATLGKLA